MRDDIFTQLRNEILNGTLLPGTQLKEVQLANRFGVSRTPIRDALSRLEDLGLAERVNRGLEVRGLDPEQVIQVYDMRILLEVEASGQAAQNRNLNDILTLEALLERDRSLEKNRRMPSMSSKPTWNFTVQSGKRPKILFLSIY